MCPPLVPCCPCVMEHSIYCLPCENTDKLPCLKNTMDHDKYRKNVFKSNILIICWYFNTIILHIKGETVDTRNVGDHCNKGLGDQYPLQHTSYYF